MAHITIWAVESDNDKEVAKCLATKLAAYKSVEIKIRAVGKKTFSDIAKRLKRKPDALEKAVNAYLKAGDTCVIFVLDSDSPIRLQQRRRNEHSAISQIERVKEKFSGRVQVALAVHEIEAWLLVDCVGICCYFAGVENSLKSREKLTKKFQSLLKRYQRGNTELIIEAEAGGKGAKEYLALLSEKILKKLSPKAQPRVINEKKYQEASSPDMVKYIDINKQTLQRNASLRAFGEQIIQCNSLEKT